jgi:Mg/Co/Ni transporter MgtE
MKRRIEGMNENKKTAIQALENMRGDNLARAQHAFKGKSKEEMLRQWGESKKTCAEILLEYEEFEAKVNTAIEWVKKQKEE